jgi:hypothetical protein
MDATPRLVATVLDSPEPLRLGRFYGALLAWDVSYDDDDFVRVRPTEGAGLSIQLEPDYAPPVWPAMEGTQQMMSHLDLLVEDLPAAVARAEELGAKLAVWQPNDGIRVMLDPDGHPFCLFLPGW